MAPGDYGIVRPERLIILAMKVERDIADTETLESVTYWNRRCQAASMN